MTDLEILVCSHRNLAAGTAQSFEFLRRYSPLNYAVQFLTGDALIGRARSLMVYKFLKESDTPYLLFIDDDIIFQPKDVEKIYQDMKGGYDVVGGVYAVRGASQIASYTWGGQHEIPLKPDIREIEYLATGFMGISRRVIQQMVDKLNLPVLNKGEWAECIPFFESGSLLTRKEPIYISEDWDFCEKVRKAGGKVYLDTSVCVNHMREQVFTVQDVYSNRMRKNMEDQLWGSIRKQQELMKNIGKDIAEFCKIDINQAVARINKGQKAIAEEWNSRSGSTNNFYITNEHQIYDLSAFNSNPQYFEARLKPLVNLRGQKILDIGCGIGTAVFMLSDSGNEVTGYDLNRKLIDFCEFKQKKYCLRGTFTTEMPDLQDFDLVICIDVLEHIEDLQGFLKDIGSKMKKGAKLYHSDAFGHQDINPMHFDHSEDIDQWLREAGLASWDDSWAVKI
jgi:2-polyprenyl-3-methyl-5-hydroxy-6-metoxy-1,4-benzoquinol methylase